MQLGMPKTSKDFENMFEGKIIQKQQLVVHSPGLYTHFSNVTLFYMTTTWNILN